MNAWSTRDQHSSWAAGDQEMCGDCSFWNFDALFQPQQHPARDAHDTFFLTSEDLQTPPPPLPSPLPLPPAVTESHVFCHVLIALRFSILVWSPDMRQYLYKAGYKDKTPLQTPCLNLVPTITCFCTAILMSSGLNPLQCLHCCRIPTSGCQHC